MSFTSTKTFNLSSYVIYKKTNEKNLISGLILGLQFFFREFYLYQMLGIVASYQSIQFQENSMIQIQQNGGKPHFGPDLVTLDLNFLFKNVVLSVTRYHGQLYNIRKKLMTQS